MTHSHHLLGCGVEDERQDESRENPDRRSPSTDSGVWRLTAALIVLPLLGLGIARTLPSSAQEEAPAIDYPKLVDITASTGIHFDHYSSPEQKFIVESMSGGVALIDYDRDGWPDIYFTNAQPSRWRSQA